MNLKSRIGAIRRRLTEVTPRSGEFSRLAGLAWPERRWLAGAVVLTMIGTALGLVVPWLLARMVDGVVEDPSSVALRRLNLLAVALGGVLVARAGLNVGHTLLMARVGERIVRTLRFRLYRHLTGLGPAFYDQRRVGELISRLMNDVTQVQAVLTGGVAEFLTSTLTLVGAVGIMLWRSPRLTVVILLLVPPVVLIARMYARLMHRRSAEVQDAVAEGTSVAEESLGAIRLVQLFVREGYEAGRFGAAIDRIYAAAMSRATVQAVFGPAVGLLMFGSLAAVIWYGGRLVVTGELGLGDLVAFLAYAGMTATATSALVAVYGRWASAVGASRRVFDLLDTVPSIRDLPGARSLGPVRGAIEFDEVDFSYGRGGSVLRAFSLQVAPGETVALVGPTGAGKSTVMRLIPRFYDVDAGAVRVDGYNVRELTLSSLRQAIGVVPQEVTLFNASIGENLRYGRLDASDGQLEHAADSAYILDFIESLPDGFDTLVGERGIRLSAGQRQRVAIARTLLKDPRILLLDEATASLDTESERYVQAALERLFEGRTTIVVAHRLSTIYRADRIAVLDRGRLVELGPHAELIERSGLYARLCAMQFADESEAPDFLRRGSDGL